MKNTLITIGATVVITLAIVAFGLLCYCHEFVTVTTRTNVKVEVPHTTVTTEWEHLEYNF